MREAPSGNGEKKKGGGPDNPPAETSHGPGLSRRAFLGVLGGAAAASVLPGEARAETPTGAVKDFSEGLGDLLEMLRKSRYKDLAEDMRPARVDWSKLRMPDESFVNAIPESLKNEAQQLIDALTGLKELQSHTDGLLTVEQMLGMPKEEVKTYFRGEGDDNPIPPIAEALGLVSEAAEAMAHKISSSKVSRSAWSSVIRLKILCDPEGSAGVHIPGEHFDKSVDYVSANFSKLRDAVAQGQSPNENEYDKLRWALIRLNGFNTWLERLPGELNPLIDDAFESGWVQE